MRFAATKEAWGVCLPVCQPTKLVAKPGCMQRNGLCCVWTATGAATGAARGGHARRASRTLAARSIHSVALLWHIPENQGEILALGQQHFVLLLQLFDCGLCLGIVHSGSEQFRGGTDGTDAVPSAASCRTAPVLRPGHDDRMSTSTKQRCAPRKRAGCLRPSHTQRPAAPFASSEPPALSPNLQLPSIFATVTMR